MKVQQAPKRPLIEPLSEYTQLVKDVDELHDQGEICLATQRLESFRKLLQEKRRHLLTDSFFAPLRQRLDSQSEDVDKRLAALRNGTYGQEFTALSVYQDVYVGAIARDDQQALLSSIGFLRRAALVSGPRRAQTLNQWVADLRLRYERGQPPPYELADANSESGN